MLAALWEADRPLLVRELRDRLHVGRPLAYTTVQTVADRLVRKKLLSRAETGRAYRYAPVQRREDHLVGIMLEALDDTPDRRSVLAHFARSVPAEDARVLYATLAEVLCGKR